MNSKNLYDILGVSSNASEDEIKKAYKKAAIKYHPDRQGGKSDKEKQEAEEKFKEIGAAYAILSDPQKRQRYDTYGTVDEDMMAGTGFDMGDLFRHMMGGFMGGNFGDMFGRSRQSYPSEAKSIQVNIPLSIEQIFNGYSHEIEYDVDYRCKDCNGVGGTGVETCPHCHGTGMITRTQQSGFGIIQHQSPCPYCNGTGKTIKNKCSKCNGNGVVRGKKKCKVEFDPGVDNGEYKVYYGYGNEGKDTRTKNGNLIAVPVYNFDENKYKITDRAVYELIDVPYYDCILGTELKRKLPNGKEVTVNIPEYSKDGTQVVLKGEGIKLHNSYSKGNYIFIIKPKMPTYIKSEEKELLKKIKDFNK